MFVGTAALQHQIVDSFHELPVMVDHFVAVVAPDCYYCCDGGQNVSQDAQCCARDDDRGGGDGRDGAKFVPTLLRVSQQFPPFLLSKSPPCYAAAQRINRLVLFFVLSKLYALNCFVDDEGHWTIILVSPNNNSTA